MKILHFHGISLSFHEVLSVTTINSTVACLDRIGPRVKFLDASRCFPYFAKIEYGPGHLCSERVIVLLSGQNVFSANFLNESKLFEQFWGQQFVVEEV